MGVTQDPTNATIRQHVANKKHKLFNTFLNNITPHGDVKGTG